MPTDILSIRDIRKSFGNLHALDGVSLDVPERKITILIGPNGSGKTTLINVISGQYKPDSGKVLFQGHDTTGLPPYDLYEKGLSRTFQIPALFWKLTVLENLLVAEKKNQGESLFWSNIIAGFGSRKDFLRPFLDGSAGRLLIKAVSSIESLLVTRSLLQRLFFEKKLITFVRTMVTLSLNPWREFFTPIWREAEKRSTEKASRILDLLGMTRVWNQPAYLLSGGQMKLVEIGRALMSDAKLLLLDEPVSGVNPTLAHEIFARIIKLRDELGLTFFIVEHRLDIALRYVDQMFAMAMGRVIASGYPDEVMKDRGVIEAYLGG